jgi:hypothetical protein
VDLEALGEEQFGEMKADEAGRACYEDAPGTVLIWHGLCHLLMITGRKAIRRAGAINVVRGRSALAQGVGPSMDRLVLIARSGQNIRPPANTWKCAGEVRLSSCPFARSERPSSLSTAGPSMQPKAIRPQAAHCCQRSRLCPDATFAQVAA